MHKGLAIAHATGADTEREQLAMEMVLARRESREGQRASISKASVELVTARSRGGTESPGREGQLCDFPVLSRSSSSLPVPFFN